jgi:hypothetical protein
VDAKLEILVPCGGFGGFSWHDTAPGVVGGGPGMGSPYADDADTVHSGDGVPARNVGGCRPPTQPLQTTPLRLHRSDGWTWGPRRGEERGVMPGGIGLAGRSGSVEIAVSKPPATDVETTLSWRLTHVSSRGRVRGRVTD